MPQALTVKPTAKHCPDPDMAGRDYAYVAPRNQAEGELADSWKEVLDI